jgi:hypothetical protein
VIKFKAGKSLGNFSTEVLFQALYEIKVNYDDIIAKASWTLLE